MTVFVSTPYEKDNGDFNDLPDHVWPRCAKREEDGVVTIAGVPLPEIAAEKGNMTVMMDGGIRRGTDVIKALALGADFVWIGRPFLYGAVVAGEAGVARAISLLHAEIDRDLALLGIRSLKEITPDLVRKY